MAFSVGRFLRRKVSTQRVINRMKLEQVYTDISQKQIIRREMLYYIWILSYVERGSANHGDG